MRAARWQLKRRVRWLIDWCVTWQNARSTQRNTQHSAPPAAIMARVNVRSIPAFTTVLLAVFIIGLLPGTAVGLAAQPAAVHAARSAGDPTPYPPCVESFSRILRQQGWTLPTLHQLVASTLETTHAGAPLSLAVCSGVACSDSTMRHHQPPQRAGQPAQAPPKHLAAVCTTESGLQRSGGSLSTATVTALDHTYAGDTVVAPVLCARSRVSCSPQLLAQGIRCDV